MTMVIDQELNEWIDYDIPLDHKEPKLKDGAPEHIRNKFKEWMKKKAEYKTKGWLL